MDRARVPAPRHLGQGGHPPRRAAGVACREPAELHDRGGVPVAGTHSGMGCAGFARAGRHHVRCAGSDRGGARGHRRMRRGGGVCPTETAERATHPHTYRLTACTDHRYIGGMTAFFKLPPGVGYRLVAIPVSLLFGLLGCAMAALLTWQASPIVASEPYATALARTVVGE